MDLNYNTDTFVKIKEGKLDFTIKKHSSIFLRHENNADADRCFTVFENLDFEAFMGERVVIVGSNGCGKSTLLRLIAGVYPLSQGKIQVSGSINSLLDQCPWVTDVSLINTVPSGIAALLDNDCIPTRVKTINLAGEALKQSLVVRLQQKLSARVVNLYGPSEDTTYTTVMTLPAPLQDKPLIGKAIDHTRLYVLDSNGR